MDWEDEIAGDTQALTAFTQTHIDRRDSLLFTFWPKKSTTKIAWAAQIVKIHQLRKISIVNFIAVEESGIGTSKHYQTEMMSNRFTYFKLHTPIRNPADRVSTCKRCFMRFLSKHCTTSIFNKKRKAAEFPTVRPQGVSESMWKSIKRQRNLALKNEEGDSAALP